MFSKELESLIEATLADGVLEEREKAALVKRAKEENVDLVELEIYINSIMQKRSQALKQKRDAESLEQEKERQGTVCPHCGTPIPPLTKICPGCGKAIAIVAQADKDLEQLCDQLGNALAKVKSGNYAYYQEHKAETERLLRKAKTFYSDNKKVSMLVFDIEEELKVADEKFAKEEKERKKAQKAAARNEAIGNAINKTASFATDFIHNSFSLIADFLNTATGRLILKIGIPLLLLGGCFRLMLDDDERLIKESEVYIHHLNQVMNSVDSLYCVSDLSNAKRILTGEEIIIKGVGYADHDTEIINKFDKSYYSLVQLAFAQEDIHTAEEIGLIFRKKLSSDYEFKKTMTYSLLKKEYAARKLDFSVLKCDEDSE